MQSFKSFFENSALYQYSCVMFELPQSLTQDILKWSKNNIPNKFLYVNPKENEGRVKKIHITVLYGIHTSNFKKIKPIIKKFNAVNIKLGKISKFENEKYDVIKIDVYSNELKKMHKELKKLEHTTKYSSYIPHCTLAYVKKNSCNHLLGLRSFEQKLLLKNVVFTPSGKHYK